jgi:hypothetical protein
VDEWDCNFWLCSTFVHQGLFVHSANKRGFGLLSQKVLEYVTRDYLVTRWSGEDGAVTGVINKRRRGERRLCGRRNAQRRDTRTSIWNVIKPSLAVDLDDDAP